MDFDFYNTWTEPDSFRAQSVIGSFTLDDVKLQKRFKGYTVYDVAGEKSRDDTGIQ